MSGKNAELPHDFDWAASQAKIVEAIEKAPNPEGCIVSVRLQAKEVLYFWRNPQLVPSGHYAKASELGKLKDLRKTARRLTSVWNDIDPELRFIMRAQAVNARFEGATGFTTTAERDIIQFLIFGSELLDRITKNAELEIRDGEKSGRRRYAEIRVIEACARIWGDRIGERPKSASHTAFCSFVDDVFKAIGIDTAEVSTANTIRSWAELSEVAG